MFVRLTTCAALLGGFQLSAADVLQLRDKASVTGRILAEKRDLVIVDLGYTVLSVPKSSIVRILRDADIEAKEAKEPKEPKGRPASAVSGSGSSNNPLFRLAKTLAPERSVRELVALIGEAVVQVRTPGGLGSGFILNEEGYLITNFHVIEGETQIGVEVYHQSDGQLERKIYKQVRIVAMN